MRNRVEYRYVGGDPIGAKQGYKYSQFQGAEFLDAWRAARKEWTEMPSGPESMLSCGGNPWVMDERQIDARKLIGQLSYSLDAGEWGAGQEAWVSWLIQRYEVSKRIYQSYFVSGKRGKGTGSYRDLELYISFSELLARVYEEHKRLPALNALMKALDSVCSYPDELDEKENSRVARLAQREMEYVEALRTPNTSGGGAYDSPAPIRARGKELPDVVLLLADTMRSRAYVQALRHFGYAFKAVLIVENDKDGLRWGQSSQPPAPPINVSIPYFVPDLRESLNDTCQSLSEDIRHVQTGSVNCPEVAAFLTEIDASLVIYSGFGSEIVRPDLIETAPPFLHMHAGWLPEYRGSTTIYYSLLNGEGCGVSAILLSPDIDVGPLVKRVRYPTPPPGVDCDYYYDSLIRADLLVRVLSEYEPEEIAFVAETQNHQIGEVYYVIHPVLKHVAILKLDPDDRGGFD